MSATVCEMMSWTSLTIRPDCAAELALETLVAAEAEELFVVDNDDTFLGILTDYELLKADLNGSLGACQAGELMQRRPTTLSPEHSLVDAVKLFRDGAHTRVPVLRDNRLMGLLHRRDVLRWMSAQRSPAEPATIPAPKFLQAPATTAERMTAF
jgi:CBS domain-containing protein